jgi:hypothetical protein
MATIQVRPHTLPELAELLKNLPEDQANALVHVIAHYYAEELITSCPTSSP